MHISLTPELEARVKAKVESGLYNNASEVIREALRFMETHDDWINELKLAHLRGQLKTSLDQLDQGSGIAIESRPELDELFSDLMQYDFALAPSNKLIISPAAHDDLRNIFRYGTLNWGAARARDYLVRIKERLWHLRLPPCP